MNKIDWHKYIDHIFCLNYLPNNRLNDISKTLTDIGIDIYDSKFFSFIYDIEHCILEDQYQKMIDISFDVYNSKSYFSGQKLNKNTQKYIFYIGLNTYKLLKIAQHFNYERIIIFEDDIIFLKDINYIIKAMDFIKTQDFDICMCQTTFIDAYHGIKSCLVNNVCEDLGNDMFLRVNKPFGVYGGAFIILTKTGINKIIKYFEDNNFMVCIDGLDTLRHLININTLFALKPLCIQQNMIEWSKQQLNNENININIDEYI